MRVRSASQAIDILGGNKEVGKLFGPPLGYRVVINWRSRGLPPDTYAVLAPALMAHGCEFSPLLFGQKLRPKPARRSSNVSPPPA